MDPLPSPEDLAYFYNNLYKVSISPNSKKRAKEQIRIVEKYSRGESLLEIGSSWGFFLNEAKKRGWQVEGIELCQEALDYSRKRFGLKIFSCDLKDERILEGKRFDTIVMFHTLEHLTEPLAFLSAINKRLNKGGYLILITPNIKSFIARVAGKHWEWLSPPEHIYLYSPYAARKILRKSGFSNIQITTRQGDARNVVYEILISLVKRWGYRDVAKDLVKGEKLDHRDSKFYRLMDLVTGIFSLFLYPLNPILCKLNLLPEILVVAQKI